MNLDFTKIGDRYVAEFTTSSDFNLHLELPTREAVLVQQRTSASGQYATIKDMRNYAFDLVNDIDFTAAIYPKNIRVVCSAKPSLAIVTTNA